MIKKENQLKKPFKVFFSLNLPTSMRLVFVLEKRRWAFSKYNIPKGTFLNIKLVVKTSLVEMVAFLNILGISFKNAVIV